MQESCRRLASAMTLEEEEKFLVLVAELVSFPVWSSCQLKIFVQFHQQLM